MKTYQTEVAFSEWALIVEFPRVREWGLFDLVVTVEHEGQPEIFEIVEIEFESPIHGCDDRCPVPDALRTLIEQTMRGREEDRDRIRVAISEGLPVRLRRAA